MFGSVILVIFVVMAALIGLAASRPDTFRYERNIRIKATPDRIFTELQDFHKWQAWSPWEGLDPNMKRDVSGSPKGIGAHYAWDGSNKVGAGAMTIRDATPSSRLLIALDFIRPFPANNICEFDLAPEGDTTMVSWSMSGKNAFMTKLMGLIFNVEAMVGKDFDKGLMALKTLTEQERLT